MLIALDIENDEGGWEADDEESHVDEVLSPWSDVTYEYDYRLSRGGSDKGQYSNAALDAGIIELQAQAAREREEWIRNGPHSPGFIRVPLWIIEGILSGKYPNSGLKFLLEPDADGKLDYKIDLADGGWVEFRSKYCVMPQEPRLDDEFIGQHFVENGIGSSSASVLSGTSTIQEKGTLWYDPNCSQPHCHFSYSFQYYGRLLGSGDESAGFGSMIALFLPFLLSFHCSTDFCRFLEHWRLATGRA